MVVERYRKQKVKSEVAYSVYLEKGIRTRVDDEFRGVVAEVLEVKSAGGSHTERVYLGDELVLAGAELVEVNRVVEDSSVVLLVQTHRHVWADR
mgnify:FL=1